MSAPADGLTESIDKMRADGAGDAALQAFRDLYERLVRGETGLLHEADVEPLTDVIDADSLPEPRDEIAELLDRAIVLKLNGGLGTSMGMTKAKSLLQVKDGLTFLDITARQVLALRKRFGARLPLVLMNSFRTRDDSLAALECYPELESDVPADLLQNRVPKLGAGDLRPVAWPVDPEFEWAPPGHGDLYTALETSGMLAALLHRGYRYAFVSNSDNLGAVMDPGILSWLDREQIPFCMEVADRTQADRKGGHLAQRREGGGLALREVAQTHEEDLAAFQDIARHRFFNTNNLWIDLRALDETMRLRGGVLGLPMIVNRKTVDPADRSSPPVVQLETAMGAAISAFDDARAIHVARRRFAPVKATNDLLVLRSDAYVLTADARLELAPQRASARPPLVELEAEHYAHLDGFDARFPAGAPSLIDCERLVVGGDVTFGAGVVVRGEVRLAGPRDVPDGAVLDGAQDA